MLLHERQRGLRPAKVVRIARALQTSRPGPQATGKRVKITDGWGRARRVLFQACREGNEKHCWGSMGVRQALTRKKCPRTTKLTEKRVKNTARCVWGGEGGGSVGSARSVVPKDLSTPDVFCFSSTRHRKVVPNPQATERERAKWL